MLLQTTHLQLLLPQPTDPIHRGLRRRQRRAQRDLHAGGELADLWGKGVQSNIYFRQRTYRFL
mgnify:CR=1 FL=1